MECVQKNIRMARVDITPEQKDELVLDSETGEFITTKNSIDTYTTTAISNVMYGGEGEETNIIDYEVRQDAELIFDPETGEFIVNNKEITDKSTQVVTTMTEDGFA